MAKGKQQVVVTLSGDRPVHEVAKELTAAGLSVEQVLDQIGSVTGSADPGTLDRLRGISGVADVSEDHAVDIGPPGSPVS